MTKRSESVQKIAFIAGLGHSGTTYLQILLCSARNTVGLGEIGLYIKRLQEGNVKHPKCSCGEQAKDCSFWGNIQDLAKHPTPFTHVLEATSEKFERHLVVDSSKAYESFTKYYLNQEHGCKVSVIFLVRDFRSWVLSRTRNARKKERFNYGIIIEAYRWLFLNLRMEREIKRSGHRCLLISYEQLVFAQPIEMNRLYDFLEMSDRFDPSRIGHGLVHDIYGNRMKDNPEMLKTIRYDSRWMRNMWFVILWPLFIPQYLYLNRIIKKIISE